MTSHYVCNVAYGSWGDEMILDGVLNVLRRENRDAIGGRYFDLHAGEVPTWQ